MVNQLEENYKAFKAKIAEGHNYSKKEYYKQILEHSNYIVNDIDNNGQLTVSKELNISQAKLSSMTQLLESISSTPNPALVAHCLHSIQYTYIDNNIDRTTDQYQHMLWKMNDIYCLAKQKHPDMLEDWRCR